MLSPTLRQLFDDPPRGFGPAPLWWWSGAKVTRDRLAWQVRAFADGGVHDLVVINLAPAGPAFGARADDPAWFGEEWWARFTDACEIAGELGTRLWFYDQIGFSGANVQGAVTRRHPEAAGRALRHRWAGVRRGRVELGHAEKPLAAYCARGRRLGIAPDGSVAAADGTGVRLVTAVPTAFDYLDPHAVGLLMDAVHHEYDRRVPGYLGTVVAGSFQDELPGTNAWSHRFAAEFRARRGYDLLDHLPALFGTDGGVREGKIRADYYAVRAELTEEALFRPLADWHRERGLLLGSDQSHPARAGYPAQSTQIYTDYFRTHRWFSAAGSDHHGDAKVHSSMAHIYGHDRVWIEAFHSSGWGGTLEDTYHWLLPFLRSGATLYNPHASYFGTAGGWFEWAPPSTDWRQPYWKQYPAFSRAVARICSIMSWGGYAAEVAVLHPTATLQALLPLDAPVRHFGDGRLGDGHADADETQRHYLDLCGTNNWLSPHVGSLDRHGISFDVVDDDSVRRAEATGGALRIRDLAYTAVLLPSASVLEEETARRLTELLDAGGRVVVVGRPPATAAGRSGDDAAVEALAHHPRLERVRDAQAGAEAVADAAGHATGEVPLLVRRQGDMGVALVMAAFPEVGSHPLRPGPAPVTADASCVTVRAAVAEAEVWNPATGSRSPASVTVPGDGTGSVIGVPLDGAPAVLVVWREERPAPAAERVGTDAALNAALDAALDAEPATATDTDTGTGTGTDTGTGTGTATVSRVVDISSGWQGRLVPTMDNTWGDLALPAGSPVDEPQIWTMEWTEGAGRERIRATYGNRVRVLPPLPATRLPEPLDGASVERILAGELPLVPPGGGWDTGVYSSSRGIPDQGGLLGLKGLVNEEFVRVAVPGGGTAARVRAIVETDRLGPAELHVGAEAGKRVWWNGTRLSPGGDGYLASARVTVTRARNVLEYELSGAQDRPTTIGATPGTPLGSFFCLSDPGGLGPRPRFMRLPDGVPADGRVTYGARLRVPHGGARAVLVVGAAPAVTVLLDGEVVARQEKVEYYEADWGAVPAFFRHEPELGAGEHTVEVVAEGAGAGNAVFVDLVAVSDTDVTALVSAAGWEAAAGTWRGVSVEDGTRRGELRHCHAVVRPHPLPDSAWLTGRPVPGGAVWPVRSTDDVHALPQRFGFTVPAGTVALDLPLALRARIRVGDAEERPLHQPYLTLPQPLRRPTRVEVVTEPTATLRGGSAWHGPVRVRTVPAPLPPGDWRERGLGGWSGGVTYTRLVEVPPGSDPVLDLGRVRGSVEVAVDGEFAGEAFCAPYRFPLRGAAGRTVRLEVTVRGTLAPYLAEATPTEWAFESQLSSGLMGPVTLRSAARPPSGRREPRGGV
ncbi:glycosyl hydrolase [Streptomyces sp. NPDC006624]|uniref:glycosyl hydrolase n=1 Tax=Streptomyces sp. NPDC006624 TaxID=3154892 RepID=UPI0033A91DCF